MVIGRQERARSGDRCRWRSRFRRRGRGRIARGILLEKSRFGNGGEALGTTCSRSATATATSTAMATECRGKGEPSAEPSCL